MKKTKGMQLLEHATGRDIRDLIAERVHKHGNVEAAAASFGLSGKGLYNWIGRLEGKVGTEITFAGFEPTAHSPQQALPEAA